jgi:hypothetical protein
MPPTLISIAELIATADSLEVMREGSNFISQGCSKTVRQGIDYRGQLATKTTIVDYIMEYLGNMACPCAARLGRHEFRSRYAERRQEQNA